MIGVNAENEEGYEEFPARRLNGGRANLGAAWSNYHITINSNRNEHNIDTGEFIASVNEVLERWSEFIVYTDANRRMRQFTEDEREELIRRVRFRVAIERNFEGRNSGVHAHVLLEVSHSTYVALDNRALQAIVRTHVVHGANVYSRFVGRDNVATILRYMLKETDEAGQVQEETDIPAHGPTAVRAEMLRDRGMGARLLNAWNNEHTAATNTVHVGHGAADVPDEVDGTERYPDEVAGYDDYEDRH